MVASLMSTLPIASASRRHPACAGSSVSRTKASSPVTGPASIAAEIGLGLTVFVELKVGKHGRENAATVHAALLAIPEVVSCHMVSGAADFLAEVVVPDLEAYERLMTDTLLTLPTIEDVRSNFAIRMIKTDAPLPVSHLA